MKHEDCVKLEYEPPIKYVKCSICKSDLLISYIEYIEIDGKDTYKYYCDGCWEIHTMGWSA